MTIVAIICLVVAVGTLAVFLSNLPLFRQAPTEAMPSGQISVLIPARNEAHGIGETIDRILASQDVDLELVILDDNSTDETAAIVQEKASADDRVRLIEGDPLPEGWVGKQYACHQLADAAQFDELVFLDADVRVEPDALARAVALRQQRETPLLSGFPRQLTGSLGEQLLTPLIQYILLCYLPFRKMRASTDQSASAGCGQFFLTDRESYVAAGGHASIKSSLHDGLTLPRAYRRTKLTTDIFDASDIAAVRMYDGLGQTWRGLLKNAHEGVANPKLILPVTTVMVAAHIVPVLVVFAAVIWSQPVLLAVGGVALLASLWPRLVVAQRFDGAWVGAALHPIAISLFLAIQWYALIGGAAVSQRAWKGRTY